VILFPQSDISVKIIMLLPEQSNPPPSVFIDHQRYCTLNIDSSYLVTITCILHLKVHLRIDHTSKKKRGCKTRETSFQTPHQSRRKPRARYLNNSKSQLIDYNIRPSMKSGQTHAVFRRWHYHLRCVIPVQWFVSFLISAQDGAAQEEYSRPSDQL